MPVELKIPQGGESINEVQIANWRKAEGDPVAADEILVELETDKASMELPAPTGGTLARILKRAGETVHVGDTIALIDDNAEPSKIGSAEARKPATAAREEPAGPRRVPPQPAEAQPTAQAPQPAAGQRAAE